MSNDFRPQRQRHGVTKKLVEGVGGVLTGAALVLLLRQLFKDRTGRPATVDTPRTTPLDSGETA